MNNQRFRFNVMHRQQVTGADSFGRHSRDSIASRAGTVVTGCARLISSSCVSARLRVPAAVECRANGVYGHSESMKDVVVHLCCAEPLEVHFWAGPLFFWKWPLEKCLRGPAAVHFRADGVHWCSG